MDNNTKEVLLHLVNNAGAIIGAIGGAVATYATYKANHAKKTAVEAKQDAAKNAAEIAHLKNGGGTAKIEEVLAERGLIDRRVSADIKAGNERRERLLQTIADCVGKDTQQNVSHETPTEVNAE